MGLSNDLISQFAKITNDNKTKQTESTVYGTVSIIDGRPWVKFDGSDRLTPANTTAAVAEGERVTVLVKDHSATITGNVSSPAARNDDVKELGDKIDEFDTIVADKVKAETAEIESAIITKLDGKYATFESLDATYASITSLESAEADINKLKADNVEIKGKITARDAEIDKLKADSLTVEVADAKYATIENLEGTNAKFNNLESTYGEFVDLTTDKFEAIEGTIKDLDVESLNAKYANIDFSNIGQAAMENFYANSGLIKNVVVGDQTITGELVGITIRGDRIIGGSIVADKLVIKGDDGIYYKLNAEGGATPDQLATEEFKNGLHGSNIIANSITAEKIKVDDLVAFDATIGNFNIGDNSIYSGAKASVDNTTRGIYMDTDGQLNFGDSNNYLKYYKDQNGNYKLDISASSLKFGTSGQSVEDVINDIANTYTTKETFNGLKIGGRNFILKSNNFTQPGSTSNGITASVTNGLWKIVTTASNDNWHSWTKENVIEANFKTGDEFTFSVEIKCDSGSTGKPKVYFKAGMGYYELQGDVSTEYSTLYYTGKWVDTNDINFHFGWGGAVGTFYIRCIKFERGNKATDWTAAPEDIEGKITETNASIKVLEDKVTSNVSETNSLKTRMSTVEQTAEDLTLSVSELGATGSASGSPIVVNDSADGKLIDLKIDGKTEQFTTTGKNLCEASLSIIELNGLKIVNNGDGTYTLNGTLTAHTWQTLGKATLKSGDRCLLVGLQYVANNTLYLQNKAGTTNYGIQKTNEGIVLNAVDEDDEYLIVAYFPTGVTFTNVVYKPMLTKDLNATYNDFEQYTGGIASPNPNYPQELKSVGDSGLFEVGVYGGNLFKPTVKTITSNGLTIVIDEDGIITVNGTSTANAFISDIGSFTCSGKLTFAPNWSGTKPADTYITFNPDGNGDVFVWTAPKTFEKTTNRIVSVGILLYMGTYSNVVLKPILNIGETSLPYEPYNKQTISLPYHLRGVGDLKDEIVFAKGIKTHRLGFEKVSTYAADTVTLPNGNKGLIVNAPNKKRYSSVNMCTHATLTHTYMDGTFYENPANFVFVGNSTDTNESLIAKYGDGYLLYELATPIETPLTDEELAAYAALHTNNPNTTIFADGSPEMHVEYFRNTEDGKKLAKKTASIQVTSDKISSNVKTITDANRASIMEAESNIEQLSDQISTLVRDGSGKSLMTQTPTGWTFSMGDFEATLNNLLSHVKIGTYNGQPCLELVVDDAQQKLMLTNTKISFMESDTTAAYISGNIMNIDHAQIDNGLSIGSGYNWAEDSDDILNLIYQ